MTGLRFRRSDGAMGRKERFCHFAAAFALIAVGYIGNDIKDMFSNRLCLAASAAEVATAEVPATATTITTATPATTKRTTTNKKKTTRTSPAPAVARSGKHRLINGVLANETVVAHLHLAKTAGSSFNLFAARSFDHVCGNKGYSSDQLTSEAAQLEAVYQKHLGKSIETMEERGFHDCDLFSLELPWTRNVEAMAKVFKPLAKGGLGRKRLLWMLPVRPHVSWLLSECSYIRSPIPEAISAGKKDCAALLECENARKIFAGRWDPEMLTSRRSYGNAHAEIMGCHFPYDGFERVLNKLGDTGILQPRRHWVEPLTHVYKTNAEHKDNDVLQKCADKHLPGWAEDYLQWVKKNTPPCDELFDSWAKED